MDNIVSVFNVNNKFEYKVRIVMVTVLEAVELPASIADLASSLAHVDGDTLTLKGVSCLL